MKLLLIFITFLLTTLDLVLCVNEIAVEDNTVELISQQIIAQNAGDSNTNEVKLNHFEVYNAFSIYLTEGNNILSGGNLDKLASILKEIEKDIKKHK